MRYPPSAGPRARRREQAGPAGATACRATVTMRRGAAHHRAEGIPAAWCMARWACGMLGGGGMSEARGAQPWRTGPGARYQNHPGPPPEGGAERLGKMPARGAGTRAGGGAAHRTWLEATAGMGMEELRRTTPTRFWTVAMMHCGGADLPTIARAVGCAT